MTTTILSLPEELVRDILSYSFHLSADDFCGFRTRRHSHVRGSMYSVQKRDKPPCQDLLLVCKRWLRIASPLLYASLSVRTPAHASTVAALLKAAPALGNAVRQLKIFGGYGKDMTTIAAACPNVETLYFYVSVKSNESIVGIKKALLLFSPTRLYLENRYAYSNKKVNELRALLETQIAKWPRLTEVHCASGYTTEHSATLDALARSSTLHDVFLDQDSLNMALLEDAARVRTLLMGATFEKVHCLGRVAQAKESSMRRMDDAQFPKIATDKVVYENYPDGDDPTWHGPHPFMVDDLYWDDANDAALWDEEDDEYGYWDEEEEDLFIDDLDEEAEDLMAMAAASSTTTTTIMLMALIMSTMH
ncbi:hypothetical protein PsYK624_080320 [Phanerochaete sordida]|uniref:Uncharacterized protein n=1 Tax=Phanerochaete sordida TaxID=48140 RepID=A0A9P3GBL2_9APHY|nr:hypothetical protein PsYK624_080320 [Phanerochaete sordida]